MVIGQCVSGFGSIKDNHIYEIGKRKLVCVMSQRFELCFRVSIIFIYVTHHTAAGLTLLPITVPVSGGNECCLS